MYIEKLLLLTVTFITLCLLPTEFTLEELMAKRMEQGYKTDLKMVVYRCTHNNITEKVSKKFRKIG